MRLLVYLLVLGLMGQVTKQKEVESLPVLMPGDEVPKFIALACPCQPPKEEKITIQVHKDT